MVFTQELKGTQGWNDWIIKDSTQPLTAFVPKKYDKCDINFLNNSFNGAAGLLVCNRQVGSIFN